MSPKPRIGNDQPIGKAEFDRQVEQVKRNDPPAVSPHLQAYDAVYADKAPLPDQTTDYYSDPISWWADQGQYMRPFGESSPEHQRQEQAIAGLLASLLPGAIASIFEAGCGRGRLANFFATCPATAGASYRAIDVGNEQLARTQAWRPDASLELSSIQAYNPARGEEYDLVVVSEVLMHIPPNEVEFCLQKLLNMTAYDGHLLIVEWVPLPGELERHPTAKHNWPHHYEELIEEAQGTIVAMVPTDRQMIYLVRP